MARFEREQSELIEKVVYLNRVSKTVKGGRVMKFSALSLLFIHTVHSGISSPLDCRNNAVALNGALFSVLNRECMSVNGDFCCGHELRREFC